MNGRIWLIPGGLTAIAVVVAMAWAILGGADPAVRTQVIEQFRLRFPGADVHVGTARLRLLGGIKVTDLRLSRREDSTHASFLAVPVAFIYHDKELLRRGKVALRKIELCQPTLRAVRQADGEWNLAGVVGPSESDGPMPIVVVRQATVIVEDRSSSGSPRSVQVGPVDLTVMNDPLPVLAIQGTATHPAAGTARLCGRIERRTDIVSLNVDLPNIPIGPALVRELTRFWPEASDALEHAEGTAEAHLSVQYHPDLNPPLNHDLRVRVRDGRFRHPDLPLPLEQIAFSARCANGRPTIEGFTARLGSAALRLEVELPPLDERPSQPNQIARHERSSLRASPDSASPVAAKTRLGVRSVIRPVSGFSPARSDSRAEVSRVPAGPLVPISPDAELTGWEHQVRRMELAVDHLPITPDLFPNMPRAVRRVNELFSPCGVVSLAFRLEGNGQRWRKGYSLTLEGVDATYSKFRYPVRQLRGSIEETDASDEEEMIRVKLNGEASGGRPIRITGVVDGDGTEPGVAIDVSGTDVPIDDALLTALPGKYEQLARSFHPTGQGDFVAEIRSPRDSTTSDNHYVVRIKGATARYDVFPYPLENVSGTLKIRAGEEDFYEFHDFVGSHHGATVTVNGKNRPIPNGDILTVTITGANVPLDVDLESALRKVKLGEVWDTFAPTGRMGFAARVVNTEHSPSSSETDRPADKLADDLDVQVALRGVTIRPEFFPYTLTDVAGSLHYANDMVSLGEFRCRHGASQLSLAGGEVRLKTGDGYWAEVKDLVLNPLVPDHDFLRALPSMLQDACLALDLRGPMTLTARRVVVDAPCTPRTNHGGIARTPMATPTLLKQTSLELPKSRTNPKEASPTIYWDAGLKLGGASLSTGVRWDGVVGEVACRGLHNGERMERVVGNILLNRASLFNQPLGAVHARFEDDPRMTNVLRFFPQAQAYGGTVSGQARLTIGPELAYEVDLTAAGVRLDEVARANGMNPEHLRGEATGRLYLAGRSRRDGSTEPTILTGGGSIDVPTGRLYNLPHMLDLLKVLNLRAPDRTAFEEAHAQFEIHGERVKVTRLDLMGNAISLGGQGEMKLDGSDVRMDFYAVWSRVLQLLPEAARELPAAVSKNLYKIEARGRIGDGGKLSFKQEAVPVLVDPLKAWLERVRQRPIGRDGG